LRFRQAIHAERRVDPSYGLWILARDGLDYRL
jgi:hypothetical protein